MAVGITLFFVFILPTNSYDSGFWREWAKTIDQGGIANIYSNPGVNYPPLVLYLLSIFNGLLHLLGLDFQKNIHIFKIFFLIFDLAVVILAAHIARLKRINVAWALLMLLNIGFWYNSLVFGQTDSMFTTLGALAVWFGYKEKFTLSSVFMALAFGTKFQAILWVPIWALTLISRLWDKKLTIAATTSLKIALAFLSTMIWIFSPYILSGHLQPALNGSYITTVQSRFNELSVHAFNFWHLILPVEQTKANPGNISSLGISYEAVGYGLIIIVSLLVFCIYILRSIRKGKPLQFDFSQLILLQGILSLTVFFFSTRMHERYVHVAAVSLLIYAVLNRRVLLTILVSVPYWLNLATVVEYSQGIMDGKYVGLPTNVAALMYLGALLLAIFYWSGLRFKNLAKYFKF